MKKTEYNLLKASIIKEFGHPEWELNKPINESATKLQELKYRFTKENREIVELKQLAADVKDIEIKESISFTIPEEILKDSWLTPFTDEQKAVINQWLLDISQTKPDIAKAVNCTIPVVRSTFRCEAFKALRKHLELAFKPLLPLEALATLRTLMRSKTENVALQAAKLVLIDAGLYKGESLDVTQHKTTEVVLDPETEEKLRKLGNQVLGVDEAVDKE